MKLTDSQLVLLSAASQRDDGVVDLGATGSASPNMISKLLSEQLIEEIATLWPNERATGRTLACGADRTHDC